MGFFDFLKGSPTQEEPEETVILDLSCDRDVELIARNLIESKITELAREEFPDNVHNSWQVTDTAAKEGITFIRAVPSPQDVGYPEFVFACVDESNGEQLRCLANYCLEGEQFSLLATAPNAPSDLPKRIRW